MMDVSRKVAPFDPQMVRDAASHYEFIAQQLQELAEEMEDQASDFRGRALDAKLKAEHLGELLEEFPDGRGTEQSDGGGAYDNYLGERYDSLHEPELNDGLPGGSDA